MTDVGQRLENPSALGVSTPASRDRLSLSGWRIVLLASFGGTLEFYDFVIFGIFAKDIADALFPPPLQRATWPARSAASSSATMAIGTAGGASSSGRSS